MLRLPSLFFFYLLCFNGRAQVITVIDKVSREALPGVLLHNNRSGESTLTNGKGEADISTLKGDSITVTNISHRRLTLAWPEAASKKKIELLSADVLMKEVVVSANRWEEQASETPARIARIGKKEIELLNPQTSADLLGTSGYVYVQKSQQAGGSPMLRGFATNRVLIIVEGVRMNNAIFRSGNLQNIISIDANAIESAEVLFGPGAVMYGSDAIGGVMDFHTLKPRFSDSTAPELTAANVMARLSSANKERTFHADVNAAGKRWSWLSSFSYSDYGDLLAGTHGNTQFLHPSFVENFNGRDSTLKNPEPRLQRGSAFSQHNFMQKVVFKPAAGTTIEYVLHHSKSSEAPRYDRLYIDSDLDNNLDFAEWNYGPQAWIMHKLGLVQEKKRGLYSRLSVRGAWQQFGESRHDRRFGSLRRRSQFEKVNAFSLNVDLDKIINERLQLFYGAEAIYNQVNSEAFSTDINSGERTNVITRYPDNSSWQAYGVYSNLRYRLRPSLILSAGLRYSFYQVEAQFDTTLLPLPFTESFNRNGAVNAAAGVAWLPGSRSRLYVNFSSGFRAPNIDDIGKVFETQPGVVVVPNRELRPEYAYNAELGAVKVLDGRVKLDAALFYTLLNNALARRPYTLNGADSINYEGVNSAVMAIQNVSSAYVYGMQAGIVAETKSGLGLSVKMSYQKGAEMNADSMLYYPLPHVAPLFGRAEISYRRKKMRAAFYSIYNAGMEYNDLSLNDRYDNAPFAKDAQGLAFVPAWLTLNFQMAVYPTGNFVITAGIENITDRLYRPFSSGISAPGRNFIVSLRWKL